jgi:tRNA(Ile)-lysidine synthase
MAAPLSGEPAPQDASSPVSPERAVHEFLARLNTPLRLLVAYSGGGDSSGLLAALAEEWKTNPNLDISLAAATVDHGLRLGSAEEARAVGALPESLGIPHHILTWEGEKPKTGIQAAAREARYRLLGGLAREIGADLIVTAHNLDDQMETVAMRQARNPEARGGISEAVLYDRRIWVYRPLLQVRRDAIRDYLAARGIGWVDDPSNDNDRFERVRVRKAQEQRLRLTPLCPAGHLPLKGGDRLGAAARDKSNVSIEAGARLQPISPLEGEMPGRAEGGEPPVATHSAATERKEGVLFDRPEDDVGHYLHANVSVHSALAAVVDLAGHSPHDAARLDAIRHLAALMGGRAHLSGRETTSRIADFLASPDGHRLTAERVVFDRRKHLLYITRERRTLPVITIQPGTTAVWDNRFRIENRGAGPAIVGARAVGQPGRALIDASLPANLPGAVGQRIEATEPLLIEGSRDQLSVKPIIAQFDRFLPLRMLGVANALAFLVGLDHFPSLPAR